MEGAGRIQKSWCYTNRRKLLATAFLPRRGAGVAEQGCLLSSYTPKGCRGFESPPLRQTGLVRQCLTCLHPVSFQRANIRDFAAEGLA